MEYIVKIYLYIIATNVVSSTLIPVDVREEKSLTKCVVSASKIYFSEGELVLISIPSEPSELVASHLMNTMKWSVLVENRDKEDYTDYNNFKHILKRPKFFIIYLKNLPRLRITLRVLKQLNVKGNFLIVSSKLFQNDSDIANKIGNIIWEEKIMHAIYLLKNGQDHQMYDVYKGQYSDQITDNYDAEQTQVVDFCSLGKYSKNATLFAERSNRTPENFTIHVGYQGLYPFIIDLPNNTVGGADDYFARKGIDVNLVNLLANRLNVKVIYRTYNRVSWGTVYFNGTATGNLKLLTENKIDMVLGAYQMTLERSFCYDASPTYAEDNLIWCAPYRLVLRQYFSLLHMFQDWISFVSVTVFLTGMILIIWFLSRKSKSEKKCYKDISDVFFNMFAVITTLPVSAPNTVKVRLFFFMVLFFSKNVSTLYQTYLTSILTTSDYVQKYNSVENIYKNGLQIYMSEVGRKFLANRYDRNHFIWDMWNTCRNKSACVGSVVVDRDSAVFVQETFVDYYVYKFFDDEEDTKKLYCFGRNPFYTNLIMRKGFPLYQDVSRMLSRIISTGLVNKWKDNITGYLKYVEISSMEEKKSNTVYLNFHHLKPVFYMLLLGNCLGLVAFFFEMMDHKKVKDKVQQRNKWIRGGHRISFNHNY